MTVPRHCMLDLETMGIATNAAIIAIGAVLFDRDQVYETRAFYEVVNLESATKHGGSVSPSTILWWMQQSAAARGAITEHQGLPLPDALNRFSEWLPQGSWLWGNGADFDNIILAHAFNACEILRPWSFRDNRCYRTLAALHPHIPQSNVNPIQHHAKEDAIYQARHARQILLSHDPVVRD